MHGLSAASLVLVATIAAGCTDGVDLPIRTAAGDLPNVLLITIDTLRADRLGAYGHTVATSPAIDALAAGGTLVERCMSSAPETAPGQASLLTGLYQDRHSVVYNRVHLDESVTTLAERLKEAGYTTAGFSGNRLLTDEFGFAQGLDTFAPFWSPKAIGSADDRGATLAADWLRAAPARPWFLWVHFMDPHGPYSAAPEWWSRDFDYPPGSFGDDPPLSRSSSNFGLGVIPRYQAIPKLDRLSQYVRRYDGEIRFTDAQVERVLGALALAGRQDDTLVVLSADHGESLTEHEEYLQHGWFLYETTLHVPLLFSYPGAIRAGARIGTDVSTVDIVPTVLDLIGVAYDAGEIDGTGFAAALVGGAMREEVPRYAVGPRKNHPFAIASGGLKLIHTPAGSPPTPHAKADEAGFDTPERYELYDLEADPGETDDLSAERDDDVDELADLLAPFEARFIHRRIAAGGP